MMNITFTSKTPLVLVVVVVEFCNKTLSNAKQTMRMQADNTDT